MSCEEHMVWTAAAAARTINCAMPKLIRARRERVVLAYLYLHFPAWAAAVDVNLGWPGNQALTEELDLN